jgi:hypothetical protein
MDKLDKYERRYVEDMRLTSDHVDPTFFVEIVDRLVTLAPKWYKSGEVTQPGQYVTNFPPTYSKVGMPMTNNLVHIHREDGYLWCRGYKLAQYNDTWRFYGPIPQCEE